jgi:hypothetical protein
LLFQGWNFSTTVLSGGGLTALAVVGELPPQTDVAWVQLAQQRDLAFLLP